MSAAVSLVPLNAGRTARPAEQRTVRDPAVRDAVREIMAAHSPLAKPLTAKRIIAKLPKHLRRTEGDVRHHMRQIWAAAAN
jgi:gamma-glutamyl:cysteine ligase YbdK (ATP-grasp superfamily)